LLVIVDSLGKELEVRLTNGCVRYTNNYDRTGGACQDRRGDFVDPRRDQARAPPAVKTHVGHHFTKLGIESAGQDHRRVLAVLTAPGNR
jgi:hypothetical protein